MRVFYAIMFADMLTGITCDIDMVCLAGGCRIHSKSLGASAIVIVSRTVSKINALSQCSILDELGCSRSGAALSHSALLSDGVEGSMNESLLIVKLIVKLIAN